METKVCTKCRLEQPTGEFYKSKRDGLRWHCKTCCRKETKRLVDEGYYNLYQREYSKRPEVKKRINLNKAKYRSRPDVRIKNMARWFTNHEIRAGRITREPCAFCGREQGEAHHEDYSQPLLIVWLCPDCHRVLHLKEQETTGENGD